MPAHSAWTRPATPLRAAVAVTLLALPLTGGSASAANAAKLLSSGTLAPGLVASGCGPSATMMLSATLVTVGTQPGVHAVNVITTSTVCSSLGSDAGYGTASGALSGRIDYVRTAARMVLVGTQITFNGTPAALHLDCAFVPTSLNPTTTFALDCTGTLN